MNFKKDEPNKQAARKREEAEMGISPVDINNAVRFLSASNQDAERSKAIAELRIKLSLAKFDYE